MAIKNYVGKGITFPVVINKGSAVIDTGTTLINSSIRIILSWSKSRIMLSEFRSMIEDLLEEPNDDLLKGLVEFFIFDNLRRWEKRIEVLETSLVITESEKMEVTLRYRITNSNIEEIFTFPFYRKIVY